MKIEDLKEQLKTDLKINQSDLAGAAAENSLLHNKYLNMLLDIKLQYRREYIDFQRAKRKSYRYYMGYEAECPPEVLDARGVKVHIEGDETILEIQKRMFLLEEKIKYLEESIGSIVARGFNIKNVLTAKMFEAGIG